MTTGPERFNDDLLPLVVDIDTLREDPGNARVHDDRNLDEIARSLEKYGQQKPIVVNADGVVIAGNGTFVAAKHRLGWSRIAATTTQLDERGQVAYAIADNRTAELATWDAQVLAKSLEGLKADGYDLAATGFSPAEVHDALRTAGALAPDHKAPNDPGQAKQDSVDFTYRVIVECDDEQHQAEVLADLEARGFKCRALIS